MISYIFLVQCEILHSVIKMGIDHPITAVKRKQFWNQSCSNLKKKKYFTKNKWYCRIILFFS